MQIEKAVKINSIASTDNLILTHVHNTILTHTTNSNNIWVITVIQRNCFLEEKKVENKKVSVDEWFWYPKFTILTADSDGIYTLLFNVLATSKVMTGTNLRQYTFMVTFYNVCLTRRLDH